MQRLLPWLQRKVRCPERSAEQLVASPRLGQRLWLGAPCTLSTSCRPRLPGLGAGLRSSRVCPRSARLAGDQLSGFPRWSGPEGVAECSERSRGRVTTAWADCTKAPQARGQSRRAMRDATINPESLISAGKPSTLCSSVVLPLPLDGHYGRILRGLSFKPPIPAEDRAASRVARGVWRHSRGRALDHHRRLLSALLMAEAWKRCMNRRSMRCFQRQSSEVGAKREGTP